MSTWTLEVLAPFTVQEHGQITTWQRGQRMTLPHDKARRVLACVGRKVRLLTRALTGHIVTWESPLFGVLRATVLDDLPAGVRVVHPLTDLDCVIPHAWLREGTSAENETRETVKEETCAELAESAECDRRKPGNADNANAGISTS